MAFKKIINMEKLWKATHNKIKQRIMNVHIFNCHMDLKCGPLKEYSILQENPYTVRYINTVLIVYLLCPLKSR